MSRYKKTTVGKVGYCDNRTLGIKSTDGKPLKGGHYVYIREVNGDKCNVNVITSLEDRNGIYDLRKVGKVKYGYLYPIPKGEADFTRWSAINLDGNIKNIPIARIRDIGKKKIKRRHKFFVGKFTKK